MVLDIQALPEVILSNISSRKVKFFEENGTITLTPMHDDTPCFHHLVGKFSDGKISINDFLREKRQETELEI